MRRRACVFLWVLLSTLELLSSAESVSPSSSANSEVNHSTPAPTDLLEGETQTLPPLLAQNLRFVNAVGANKVPEALAALQAAPEAVRREWSTHMLASAARECGPSMVKLLVQHGALPDQADDRGNTPLHLAVLRQDDEITAILLDAGANVESRDGSGATPLRSLVRYFERDRPSAVRTRSPQPLLPKTRAVAELLLRRHGDILASTEGKPGDHALGAALRCGQLDLAEWLIVHSGLPPEAEADNERLLHLAARHLFLGAIRHWNQEKQLTAPRLQTTNSEGLTALQLAARSVSPDASGLWRREFVKRKTETAGLLMDLGATLDPLAAAALDDAAALRKLARDSRADLDLADGAGATPLHWAVGAGAEQAGITLLQLGANPDRSNAEGSLPLHLAASGGLPDLVAALLAHPPALDAADSRGRTALHLAVDRDSTDIVELLLWTGANPNLADHAGRRPLEIAVQGGFEETALLLLRHGAAVPTRGPAATSLLHDAVRSGFCAVSQSLLRRGIDVDAPDQTGCSALFTAVRRNDLAHIELLLMNGADIKARDTNGNSILHLRLPAYSDVAIPAPWRDSREHPILWYGRDRRFWSVSPASAPPTSPPPTSVTAFLLDHGADPNATNVLGDTPLHHLAREGQTDWPADRSYPAPGKDASADIVGLLVKHGARIDAADPRGRTPLHRVAMEGGSAHAALLLLQAGADPNATDPQGWTPLHHAVVKGFAHSPGNLLELLLRHGANANAKSSDGSTPLHLLAAREAYPKSFLSDLLKAGADVNAVDSAGHTPLHIAAAIPSWSARAQSIPALVNAGGDVNALDRDGQTPLHHLAKTHIPMTETGTLNEAFRNLARPSNLDMPDARGNSPLHLTAAAKEHLLATLLVASHADVRRRNADGLTPAGLSEYAEEIYGGPTVKNSFYGAITRGDADTVAAFLDIEPSLATRPCPRGESVLQLASVESQNAMADLLLQRGATLDPAAATLLGRADLLRSCLDAGASLPTTNIFGRTVLHHAARRGHLECLQILLERGLNPDLPDSAGRSVWLTAGQTRNPKTMELLRLHGARPNAFDAVALTNVTLLASVLAARPSEAVPTNSWGNTPLHEAVRSGTTPAVTVLLSSGASPSAPGAEGRTPLHLAVRMERPDLVQCLLDAHAAVDAFDGFGLTALHYAAVLGHEPIARALLDAGASPDRRLSKLPSPNPYERLHRSFPGYAPLHMAVLAGRPALVALLISRGADVEQPNAGGETPRRLGRGFFYAPSHAAFALLDGPSLLLSWSLPTQVPAEFRSSDPSLGPTIQALLRTSANSGRSVPP